MREAVKDVAEFHLAMEQPVRVLPTEPSRGEVKFRRKLIQEEMDELDEALRVGSLAEVAKEICDLIYVLVGLALYMGLDLPLIWREVHRSNMSKMGPDGKAVKREDGKVLKGDQYQPARIEQILQCQVLREQKGE